MRRFLLIAIISFPLITSGQSRYFVYLKDKTSTPYSISNPAAFLSQRAIDRRSAQNISITEKDLPISPNYLNQISTLGFQIKGKSKWLNAVLVEGESSKLNDLKALSFVEGVEGDRDIRGSLFETSSARKKSKFDLANTMSYTYGASLNQIKMLGADSMHNAGFTGSGILIGVIDAGFPNVNTAAAFATLRNNNRIKRTYNFVKNTSNVYSDHPHGTNVLSIITGVIAGNLYGTAPEADVALYITEDNDFENRQEEVFWAFAAEDADSLGVDVINSSLGYSEFDDPTQDYPYSAMDGKTAIISKAAEYAASVGIIVVIAAGNEGDKGWHYITAPADGPKVIGVGAVNKDKLLVAFSSRGPSSDGRIKPDVSAMGSGTIYSNSGSNLYSGSGTSYAAPLIAGFMASLKQQFPQFTSAQMKEILLKSADRYSSPNNDYGYGIPSYTKALQVINSEYLPPLGNECPCLDVTTFPNPLTSSQRPNIKIGNTFLPSGHLVSLIDSSGKLWMKDAPFKELNMQNLSPGIYFLNFNFKGQSYSEKIVIIP